MATTRELRRRIGSVKNTEKITKAVKMVSVAKMRRAQERILALRPYAETMQRLLQNVVESAPSFQHELIARRSVHNAAVMVVTSDRGLCGAFNANIIRLAVHHIDAVRKTLPAGGKVHLYVVGKKAFDFFSRRDYALAGEYPGFFNTLTFGSSKDVSDAVVKGYLDGHWDSVDLVYSKFKSIAVQTPTVEHLLPFTLPAVDAKTSAIKTEYIYEPNAEQVLARLLPKNITMQVWKVMLESNASEHSARMVAMDNATKNANDLIKSLSLVYNKARQASITKEILEIVSGAEALKGG